jgi:hypothetical protein
MKKPKINPIAIALIIVVLGGVGYFAYRLKHENDLKTHIPLVMEG